MNYDDELIRQKEEEMANKLQAIRDWCEQTNFAELNEMLTGFTNYLAELSQLENPTQEEQKELIEGYHMIKKLLAAISADKALMEESLIRRSILYYQEVKKLAEAGDSHAQKVYEDLKPAYLNYLQHKLNESAN